jgi:perosamine synthetase
VTTEWKLPLYKIYTDDEDINAITKIIKRGTYWALGPEIEEFENAIKEYVGCDYCVTLNSGTSALHATLLSYEIGTGDDVLVPSFSFISTANSVLFVDANPIFTDIEPANFGLDLNSISKNITKKTKAIIPMDYGGLPCKIEEIKNYCQENNLILIEDAAEALGASVNNKKIGSISDASIFSFCGNKVLTTGEGGAVTTNSREIFDKIKLIRSHGRVDSISYFDNPSESEYLGIGYNWRMSSITASLGLTQLNKLDKLINMRRNNAKKLTSILSKHSEIKTPPEISGYKNIYQMYTILLSDKKLRDSLHDFLIEKKIFCKVYFNPIHLTSFYKKRSQSIINPLQKTEELSDKILTLPLYPNMTDEEIKFLTESISEFFENR